MTCIVGIQHNGRVLIGGDSAGVAGLSIQVRADAKVFRNSGYIMGFTSSFRMGQLLRYAFKPPRPEGDLDAFMATTFVDGVRAALREGGWLSTSNEQESGGTFLVGIRGVLYAIESDFQIARTVNGYTAVGCGEDIALGALYATRDVSSPRRRITLALEAAAEHSAGVTAPFVVEATR